MTVEAAEAPPLPRVLHPGDVGPDVLADKRALVRWNKAPANVVLDNQFGGAFEKLVEKFQQHEGLHVDGILGPLTFAKMLAVRPSAVGGTGLFDAYGIELLHDETVLLEPRHLFCSIADLTVHYGSLFGYTEAIGEQPGDRDWWRVAPVNTTGSNWQQIHDEHGPFTSDCSAHYIGCGEHAGIPSNVASGVMDSDGATAALLDDLETITRDQLLPGDGAFFVGPDYPGGKHVTIIRAPIAGGDFRVVNNGGPDGYPPIYSTLSAQASWEAANGAPTIVYKRLPV